MSQLRDVARAKTRASEVWGLPVRCLREGFALVAVVWSFTAPPIVTAARCALLRKGKHTPDAAKDINVGWCMGSMAR